MTFWALSEASTATRTGETAMQYSRAVVLLTAVLLPFTGSSSHAAAEGEFPSELVSFVPHESNPVFAGTGRDTWDRMIRERGYILREGDTYHLWYTGYNHNQSDSHFRKTMSLGYATSPDGLTWTRHPENPIFDESWTEDMMVLKQGDTYYMFAEGLHDIPHMLTSPDRVHWRDHGRIDVRQTNNEPLDPGPYGTPTVWVEAGQWYLFYERRDLGIWLATSADRKVWVNVQDDPVIAMGPEEYDKHAVAMNQVIKRDGKYYGYYHACAHRPWRDWTTNVAMSTDLIHWTKYDGNPILSGNKSSGTLVHDGQQYRLYTTHPDVRVYLPKKPD
jgi:beta-1,2-mannobiose phosphorylase / 1,2-beta-oligomannan phosphorylase